MALPKHKMNWDYGRDTYSEIDVVNERMSMHAAQTERAIENLRQQVLAQQAQQQPMYSGGGATMAPHTMNPSQRAQLVAHGGVDKKTTVIKSPWNSKQTFLVENAKNPKEAYGQLLVKGFITADDIPREYLPDFYAKDGSTYSSTANPNMYKPGPDGNMCAGCDSWVFANMDTCQHCGNNDPRGGQPKFIQPDGQDYEPDGMKETCESCGERYNRWFHGAEKDAHEMLDKFGRCRVKREQWWKKFRALYWHRRGKQPELFTLNA